MGLNSYMLFSVHMCNCKLQTSTLALQENLDLHNISETGVEDVYKRMNIIHWIILPSHKTFVVVRCLSEGIEISLVELLQKNCHLDLFNFTNSELDWVSKKILDNRLISEDNSSTKLISWKWYHFIKFCNPYECNDRLFDGLQFMLN